MAQRLTDSGITLLDILKWSRAYYKSKDGDDKAKRAKLDCINAKIVQRNNFNYNPSTKKWEQQGIYILFVFMIKSSPKSYHDTSGIKNHIYPIYLQIHNFDKKLKSTFKLRDGGLKKPIFTKEGMSKEQRQKITAKNILNGTQLQFFFESQYLYYINNLLFGRCYANRKPSVKNPKNKLFLSKHSYAIITKFLIPLFQNDKFKALINKTYKLK